MLLQVRHVHANPLLRSSLASKLDLASFRCTWCQPSLSVSAIAVCFCAPHSAASTPTSKWGHCHAQTNICPTSSDKVFLQKDAEYPPGVNLPSPCVLCLVWRVLHSTSCPVCAHRGKQAAVTACIHVNFMHSILMSVCLCALASTVSCVLQMLLVLV